jgi:hypothetical protein
MAGYVSGSHGIDPILVPGSAPCDQDPVGKARTLVWTYVDLSGIVLPVSSVTLNALLNGRIRRFNRQ